MRTVLLDHAHREDEQCPLPIKGVNLWEGELFELVDSRARGNRAVALERPLILRRGGGSARRQNGQRDEHVIHAYLLSGLRQSGAAGSTNPPCGAL